MHAYMLLTGTSADIAERSARSALTKIAQELPSIGAELSVHSGALETLPMAWASLAPSRDFAWPLIQTASSARHFCLCFGELSGQRHTAASVLATVESEGTLAARSLNGCYAAVVIDYTSKQLVAFTDLIGMRAPRFAVRAQQLYLASHDLALVASGAVEGELDYDSIAATVACDWSLGRHPLVRDIAVPSAHEVIVWQNGKLERRSSPVLDSSRRVAKRDASGKRQLVDAIADTMELGARKFAENSPALRCSLTAGKDSRMVLALLLQAGLRRPVVTQTAGTRDSLDATIAAKIARISGVEHEVVPVAAPHASNFEAMSQLLSFSMNGMTNAKRALAALPRWNPEQRVLAGGVGGGIFAGAFYHYFHLERAMPDSPRGIAEVLRRRRFRRIDELPFADPACAHRLIRRLELCLEPLFQLSSRPYDVVDLFYLYERYAQWAALGVKNTWARRWTPFENTAAIRLAYQLPEPIGDHALLQSLLVRRHLPLAAYWLPINGEALLPLQGGGLVREFAQRGVRRLMHHVWLSPKSRTPAPSSFEEVRAATLNGPLRELVLELLTRPGSVSVTLLGRQGIQRLLARHQSTASELQTLGFLITAEVFRQQLSACSPHRVE